MANTDVLKDQYEQVCRSHDGITDLRLKLLGFLPLASGTGVFVLLASDSLKDRLGPIGLFGFAVTAGLLSYELRAIQECLQLRKVGQCLEEQQGFPEHMGRFGSTNPKFLGPKSAGPIVYGAVLASWLYVASVGFSWPIEVRLSIPIVYLVAVPSAISLRGRSSNKLEKEPCPQPKLHLSKRMLPVQVTSPPRVRRRRRPNGGAWG